MSKNEEFEPLPDSIARTAPRINKVIRVKTGAVMITLTHIIPKKWKYVEVIPEKITSDEVVVRIRRIGVFEDEPTEEIKRSIQ
ncbi:MAG: hypothetical protein QXS21_05985 [Thermoproteota archaeon]